MNKSLSKAKTLIENGEKSSEVIINQIKETINSEPLARIDYVEVVDNLSMEKVKYIEKSVLVATAVYIGKTRLIDNFIY